MDKPIFIVSKDESLRSDIKKALTQVSEDLVIDIATNEELAKHYQSTKPTLLIVDFNIGSQAIIESICIVNSINGYKTPIIVAFPLEKSQEFNTILNAGIDDFIDFSSIPSLLQLRVNICIERNRICSKFIDKSEQFNDISLAVSQAGSSLLIIDKNGSIVWVNEGFEMLYECELQEFTSKYGGNVFQSHFNPRTAEAMKRCAEDGEFVVYESIWFTNNNRRKNIQTSLTPIYDSQGEFSKIIAIETDITDLKQAEEALSDKHDNLLTTMEHLEEANEQLEHHRQAIEQQKADLQEEKDKSESLLLNILPEVVAHQLKKKGFVKPKTYNDVSVMFADFVGFSTLINRYENIADFLAKLSFYFETFDEITSRRYIEKIKTIGDCYMCAGGIPQINKSHPLDTILAGLEIQKFVEERAVIDKANNEPVWQLRIGIHSGPIMAGVIGKKKFAYDIWGDTVNIASRVQSNGIPGMVRISESTYEKVKDFFEIGKMSEIDAKNIGLLNTYIVKRILPEFSEDEMGYLPNEAFNRELAKY